LGDAGEYRMSQERRDVLDLLRRSDGLGLKPKEISTELHKDYGAVKKLLYDMRKADLLHSDAKGRYTIIEQSVTSSVTRDFTEIFYPPGCTDAEAQAIYERATG